jgi:hypothetical protein
MFITAYEMICCYYAIRQLMFDIWYITLSIKVKRYNKKDRPVVSK